ncbi:dihydrolipoamide acetyltransferase family protein [Halopenitus salinus]|uniref:Dihydrolipoamide acetyltransferase family protein n=1 Tax=Halopenitus salinus TaxID=1198295 RepID=A0ABD5UU27_9EURY
MYTITLPKSGKTVEEGTILEWHAEVGDPVEEGDPVLSFESEKMSSEIAAEADGVLLERLVEEGETVSVGTELGYVGDPGELTEEARSEATSAGESADEGSTAEGGATTGSGGEPESSPDPSPSPASSRESAVTRRVEPGTYRSTPSARRAAREANVDPDAVAAATGAKHLTRDHVEAYLEGGGDGAEAGAEGSVADATSGERASEPAILDETELEVEPVANPTDADALATPWARVLASNHGVSIAAVAEDAGTDRVRAADVEAYLDRTLDEPVGTAEAGAVTDGTAGSAADGTPGSAVEGATAETESAGAGTGVEEPDEGPAIEREDPLAGTAGVMFERMSRVTNEYASTTTVARVDVTDLLGLYDRLSAAWDATVEDDADGNGGAPLSLTAFVIRAVGRTLPRYDVLNAEVTDDESLRVYEDVNVGIAVNTDDGLLVPTIYDADDRPVRDLSREIDRLAEGARTRSLERSDLENGTFTVSNAGSLGAYINTPQINPPQTAILGMCTIFEEAGVVDGEVEPREMMHLTLTYDHRVVEGATAVGFLQEVKSLLESPESLLS